MKNMIEAILTDETVRSTSVVESQLSSELSAGSPWLTESE